MQIKKVITALLMPVLCMAAVAAQNKDAMGRYQQELTQLFDKAFNAATDNERYNANEQAMLLLEEALLEENSFKWKWTFDSNVSVLTLSLIHI